MLEMVLGILSERYEGWGEVEVASDDRVATSKPGAVPYQVTLGLIGFEPQQRRPKEDGRRPGPSMISDRFTRVTQSASRHGKISRIPPLLRHQP